MVTSVSAMNFFMVSFRCVLFASAATRRRLRETIYHERRGRRCMCYTKCTEVRDSEKGMDMRKLAKVHMPDSQGPCLRHLSSYLKRSRTVLLQSFKTPKHFLRKTRAGQVCRLHRVHEPGKTREIETSLQSRDFSVVLTDFHQS